MNDVVERVARAMFDAAMAERYADFPERALKWPPMPELRHEWVRSARAAIDAMREPTEAMIAAAWIMRSSLDDAPTPGKMFADLWRTMLSAALADASPDIGKEGIGNDVR